MMGRIKSFLKPDKEYHHFGSWSAPSSSVRHVKIVDQPHNLKTHVKVKRVRRCQECTNHRQEKWITVSKTSRKTGSVVERIEELFNND